ncbi:MAG TPA: hypothetical protein VJA21_22660 [Verrucomicrobiae bacterium]
MRALLAAAIECLIGLTAHPGLGQIPPYLWQQQGGLAQSPGANFEGWLVYDNWRGVSLYINRDYAPETWEWDGAAWTPFPAPAIAPGWSCGMVFDNQRGVAVLYCEVASLQPGTTWEWNGTAWRLASANSPTSRNGEAMAYDSDRGRTLLFGGAFFLQGPEPAWIWEWDGTQWRVFTTPGPPRLVGCSMAYDAERHLAILFGGRAGIGNSDPLSNQTWGWNGTNWTLLSTSGASPREGHMMIYEPTRKRVLLFGGVDAADNILGDLWEWIGAKWVLSMPSGPGRYNAGMAYDTQRQSAWLFGGRTHDANWNWYSLQDTWRLRSRALWVDYAYAGLETGDYTTPFRTLGEAANAAAEGVTIKIKPGTGIEPITIKKWLNLQAPLGPVTIQGK